MYFFNTAPVANAGQAQTVDEGAAAARATRRLMR